MRRAKVAVAAAVASALAVGACLGAASDPGGSSAQSTTSTVPPSVDFVVSTAGVESMRAEPVALPDEVRSDVVAALEAWVDGSIVGPAVTGQPAGAGGLEAAFTPAAAERLAPGSAERAAMVEEGARGVLVPERAAASLVGLADQAGVVALVTATIDIAVVLNGVSVVRTGEVVLMPVPGGWRIDGFDVVARRDSR